MDTSPSLRYRPLILIGLPLLISGCILIFGGVETEPVDTDAPPVAITSPVRAHLTDGSIVQFRNGFSFDGDNLRGEGVQWNPTLTEAQTVRSIALDEVAAMETYRRTTNVGASVLVSALATGAGVVGSVALFKAIFGSCPTVYAPQGDSLLLEAESFPNSIVPLFEVRDVDRLRAQPRADGVLTLEIRNEALETHYINHLELLDVRHEAGVFAVPNRDGGAYVLSDFIDVPVMTDRAGRDVRAQLSAADGTVYATTTQTMDALTKADLRDHIDLVLPRPDTDTVAVTLRLRNSLLNTVFFYEFMLESQGLAALDWMEQELNSISTAVRLGEFYARHMGLRVQVWDGEQFAPAGKVGEVGPIAWDDAAVLVPVPAAGDSLRIRLSFIADAWRIDRVRVAMQARTATPTQIPLERVYGTDTTLTVDALPNLRTPDTDYHVTFPGTRFWAEFTPPSVPPGTYRTFFLAAQGYYTEWMRGHWIRREAAPHPFEATDATLFAAIQRWREVQPAYERRFEASKIPVR